jgi:hypothetical protein
MTGSTTDSELALIWNSLQKTAFFNYNIKLGIDKKILENNDLDLLVKARIYNTYTDINNNDIRTKKLGDRTVHWCPNIQV